MRARAAPARFRSCTRPPRPAGETSRPRDLDVVGHEGDLEVVGHKEEQGVDEEALVLAFAQPVVPAPENYAPLHGQAGPRTTRAPNAPPASGSLSLNVPAKK